MTILNMAHFQLAALVFGLSAGGAWAGILGFDGPASGMITEDGFQYENSSAYGDGYSLYLHGDSAGMIQTTFRASDGVYFDAISVDMSGYEKVFRTGRKADVGIIDYGEWIRAETIEFDNYHWVGLRGDKVVATQSGKMLDLAFETLTFAENFRDLSALQLRLGKPDEPVSILYLDWGFGPLDKPGLAYCNEYCAGLKIDNLRLELRGDPGLDIAAVPLPGGLVLLGSVMAMGLAMGRRKRRG